MKLSLLLFTLLSFAAFGQLKTGWSTEFTGSFDGKKQVRLLLYLEKDNSLFGSFYNTDELVRYKVKGKITGNDVHFVEFKDDKEVAKFSGVLSSHKKPTIVGTYKKGGKDFNCKFSYHIHFPARPGNNLYSPISADSTKAVEEFATMVKKSVLDGKKDIVIANVHYPLDVFLDGKWSSLKNKEELLKNYDKVFSSQFLDAVKKNSFPMNMTTSYKGVWLGFNREIVIQMMRYDDEPFELRVSEINNKPPVKVK